MHTVDIEGIVEAIIGHACPGNALPLDKRLLHIVEVETSHQMCMKQMACSRSVSSYVLYSLEKGTRRNDKE